MIEFLLALGPLVVAPLGFRLLRYDFLLSREIRFAQWMTATAAVSSLLFEPNIGVAVLTIPWFFFTSYVALRSLLFARFTLATIACGYLAVGAGWLVLAVGDVQPLDLSSTIVYLTAVHFHFAGFGALLIADAATERNSRLRKAPAFGVAAAMPLVAVGFTSSRAVGLIGIALITASLALVAVLTLQSRPRTRASSVPLAIGSLTILCGMALAFHYGLGTYVGFATLSIERMAQTHGLANAVFVATGLWGWGAATTGSRARMS